MSNIILKLEHISKSFDGVQALKDINLEVKEGEFLTLLGPSGCGKTTMLRIIAGMEQTDSGRIFLNAKNVTNEPANNRDVNMVFQNYALFPHMTVSQNIGYGLKIDKLPKNQIREKVAEMLKMVRLEVYEKRMPNELSGGQKQRVAIARALVKNPKVLLLDEPLGALDLQLRRQMQIELKSIQERMGITFIYITHDQEEALNMSDRIAVMRAGGFSQIGTPEEIYSRPKTDFVARFVGEANVLKAQAIENDHGILKVKIKGGTAKVFVRGKDVNPGDMVNIAVRSDSIYFPEEGSESCMEAALQAEEDNMSDTFCVEVKDKHFTAGMLRIVLETDDGKTIIASRHGIDSNLSVGDRIHIGWEPANAVIVDEEESDE